MKRILNPNGDMLKEPRVIDIIKKYQKGNIQNVYDYLTQNEMIVDPSTWAGQLKKTIEAKQFQTAKKIIELTAYKFIKL